MKKLYLIILIIFLTFLNTRLYFNEGLPYTHDGENHLARFANYKLALKEGQFPPRFAPNLMNRYGYPVFNYNYPLANLLSLPFSALNFEYETTFKLLVVLSVSFGLIGVARWLTELNFSHSALLIGVTAYGVSPYLLNTILFRGNIGEIMALALFPWLLVLINELASENILSTFQWFKWIVITTLFLLSHNVAVVFGLPLVVLYGIVQLEKHWLAWKKLGCVYLISALLSLWFWLPAIAEKKEVVLDAAGLSKLFETHFPTLTQLMFAPLTFGFSFAGTLDSLSFAVGFAQLFALLGLSLIMISKSSQQKNIKDLVSVPVFVVSLAWLLLIFQLSFTSPIWNLLPVVRFIQFPWRLTLFLSIFLTPIAAWFWEKSNPSLRKILVLLILIQVSAFYRVKPLEYFHHDAVYYDSFPQSTTTANENLPKTFGYLMIGDWQPTARILEGEGKVVVESWRGSSRKYHLELTQPSLIVEPTMQFLGWQTQVNGKRVAYTDSDEIKGRIAYSLEPGSYQVSTHFTQRSWPRIIGNSVSMFTLIGLIVWFLASPKRYHAQFFK